MDATARAVKEVSGIVTQVRERWPGMRIVLKANSGFCREEVMDWYEANKVNYLRRGCSTKSLMMHRLMSIVEHQLLRNKSLGLVNHSARSRNIERSWKYGYSAEGSLQSRRISDK